MDAEPLLNRIAKIFAEHRLEANKDIVVLPILERTLDEQEKGRS